jgi:histidine racemase
MMREVDYVKCNPTQNMTILVKTNHLAEDYKRIASRMMSYDSVHAEQVGFVEEPTRQEAAASLRMAGGEFCGNACMSLAAHLADEQGIQPNDPVGIVLETSGTDQLVTCLVRRVAEAYRCQLAMPVPIRIEQSTVMFEGDELTIAVVRYEDFFHVVIEADGFRQAERRRAENLAKLLGVTSGANLIGVLLVKPESHELAPLIHVPALDSMIWERGCGSGTASLGAYLSWRNKGAIDVPIRQPGGSIRVTSDWEQGRVTSLRIEGTVGIVAQGKAFIDV